MSSLVVSEVFGPTIQGEGSFTGQLVAFIRLGGCNLACSWCDTPYTWDGSRFDLRAEMTRTPITEIVQKVIAMEVEKVVISGGEPLIQQKQAGWENLLIALEDAGIDAHIETNGTIIPNATTIAGVTHFTVSPKLAHSGDTSDKRINREALEAFAKLAVYGAAIFKFVAKEENDLDEIASLVKEYDLLPETVWVMPEGATTQSQLENLQKIADAVIARGWNLTTRLHTLIWDLKRGV